uniref:complex I NDUFA9 subunit family protein n=1 Tax=Pararhizobium sp. IMCC3301 TaxID=3067904 RepID=UPI002742742E|nr:complex I NDUFA9 subunit family protein [Pararhizobium sp. IMCC3301]
MHKHSGMEKRVTVFGGSGFVGRHVVQALARRGYRVRVAVRRPDLAGFLRPLGAVGQIQPVQANLRYPDSIVAAVADADYVVNLVGLLLESGAQKFDAVQARGAAEVARAAKQAGVERLVHMSAIGADAGSPAAYARSKAEGEAAVLREFPEAVIVRPSIIFGPDDDFFNRFAAMARLSPVLPLIGGGVTKFQPVFVGDVAEAIALGVDGAMTPGKIYELGGPDVASFRECLELMLKITQRKRALVSLPWWLAELQGKMLGILPNAPLTHDQVLMLKRDNVVGTAAKADKRTLTGLGISPRSMEAILPTYLIQYRERGQFEPEAG